MILIIGANGQIGSVLTKELINKFGIENVIASDLKGKEYYNGIFEIIDAMDLERINEVIHKYRVTQIYHLAAILSAKGEENPLRTWDTNLITYLNVLEAARINEIEKVFFPSSIAVFGAGAPQNNTPNDTCLCPHTVYGMSKVAGENWGQYYYNQYGVDVRSLRYPGIIGYQSMPGGGTTDYAVEIYHKAVKEEKFTCFLKEDSYLPMMYMDDAIRATIELMEAPKELINVRTSYNLSGISFSPSEIVNSIKEFYPNFEVEYNPDFRQDIADRWPYSISDIEARIDWGWQPKFDLKTLSRTMIMNLKELYIPVNA